MVLQFRKHSQQREVDMTRGSPVRLILTFAGPLVLGNLFQQLYSFVDAIVVGRYVGVDALAAIGCTSWVVWLINAFVRDSSNAFSIAASVRVGNRNKTEFRAIVGNAVLVCIVMGLAATVLLAALVPFILNALSVQANVYDQAYQYLMVYILSIPLAMVFNIAAALLRATGNSTVTFNAMTASTVFNVVMDLVFVLVFGMGVLGAAVATWLSQGISMAVALAAAAKHEDFHLSREDLRPDPALLKELFRLWLPMIFNSTIIAIGGLYVEESTNSIGSSFTAGLSAGTKIFCLLEAVVMAIQTGASVYAGQNLGAKQYRRIREGLIKIVAATMLIAVALVLLVMRLGGSFILNLFLSDADPAAYERAYQVAMTYLHYTGYGMFIMTPMYLHRVTIQTLGYPNYAALAGVFQMIVRVLTVTLLPPLIGETAYFFTEIAAWGVSLPTVSIPCYLHINKMIRQQKEEADTA